MENSDEIHNDHFFYKFKSIDKDLGEKVKCLLKGCHRFARYSVSLFKPNTTTDETQDNYKQIVKFICSNHLENWDSIKVSLLDDKVRKIKKE